MYAIRFGNVTKKYKLGFKKESLRDIIPGFFKNISKRNNKENNKGEFLALNNVNFDVKKGEILGVIGQNGAGKTTMLKLLSKITIPTSGTIEVNGKMSALIEVGAGFHPDLTGRENIYLNGTILGLKRREIEKKFDQIVEFAEIEKFIDTPVRHYSSGMYVRLGFSISAHIEPEILLIDEVLSVGDMRFQMKCLKVMEELKKRGTTIVFISHNLFTVRGLCSRVIFLSKGRIVEDGEPEKVINTYKISSFDDTKNSTAKEALSISESGENASEGEVVIKGVEFLDSNGNPENKFIKGDKVILRVKYNAKKKVKSPVFGILICRADGVHCYRTDTWIDRVLIKEIEGEGFIDVIYHKIILLSGKYYVNAGIYEKLSIAPYDYLEKISEFEINDKKAEHGVCYLEHSWELNGQALENN